MDPSATMEAVHVALMKHPKRGSEGYPEEVKAAAIRHARAARAAGMSWMELADGLPMSSKAIQAWIRQEEDRRGSVGMELRASGGLEPRRVEVLLPESPVPQPPATTAPRELVLMTPRGYRIDGLGVAELLELLRVLG
jgi:hypothetical protein